MTVLAFLVALLAVPVACAVGTAVHESQTTYLTEARAQRDQVTATVTADSAAVDEPYSAGTLTPVRWTVGFDTHVDSVHSQQWRKAGESMTIWVDHRGTDVAASGSRGFGSGRCPDGPDGVGRYRNSRVGDGGTGAVSARPATV